VGWVVQIEKGIIMIKPGQDTLVEHLRRVGLNARVLAMEEALT
jgi:hypothetical protein